MQNDKLDDLTIQQLLDIFIKLENKKTWQMKYCFKSWEMMHFMRIIK